MLQDSQADVLEENGVFTIKVNPKIFPMDIIYAAAYSFTDKSYLVFDGDPDREIIVRIRPKNRSDKMNLGLEFHNQLIVYADQSINYQKTREIREIILKKAMLDSSIDSPTKNQDASGLSKLYGSSIDDPDEISIPWDDKHGKPNSD